MTDIYSNEAFRVLTKSTDKQKKIRMSSEMLRLIKDSANRNGRTVNGEILYRIAQAFRAEINKEVVFTE